MPSLHILKGPNEGTLIPLEGDRFVLGRSPECAVVIPLASVNREHAQIVRIGGKYFIEDRQSRNGTFVNNQQISTRTALKNNDRIRICDFIAAFLDQASVAQDEEDADGVGRVWPGLAVFSSDREPLEATCRKLRASLQTSHRLCDDAEANGLHQAMTDPSSQARQILGVGFHRLIVLDAESGRLGSRFDLDLFLRHAYDQLVRAYDLKLSPDDYHPEIIAQVLKEEQPSLFCFLNVQLLRTKVVLRRLRGFAQERHQVLFLCQGKHDPSWDEPVDEDSESHNYVETTADPKSTAADRLRLLIEMSGNLSKTFELDTQLPKMADSLFQVFRQADRCFLIVADGEKNERLVPRVVKTRKPTDEGTARFSKSIVRKALEEGRAFLSDDASRDDRIQLSQSVVDFRIRNFMCAPLCKADGKAFGVIQLDTQDRSKKFTQEDLELLCGVANQASIALENARLFDETVKQQHLQRDLELAKALQVGFLPSTPRIPGYDFFAHCEQRGSIGGDYYDYLPLPDGRLTVVVCDVAGAGVPAALLATSLIVAGRFLSADSPTQMLDRLNNWLFPIVERHARFACLLALTLDPRTHEVVLVSAGHASPLLYRSASGELIEAIPNDVSGVPLGIMEDFSFDSCRLTLQPNEALLLFTDGVHESLSASNVEFQRAGIDRTLKGVTGLGAKDLGSRLVAAVNQHAAGRERGHRDDFTVVALGRCDKS